MYVTASRVPAILDPLIISCMQGSGEDIRMNDLELANDHIATYMVGREML